MPRQVAWTDAQFAEMSWHDNHVHGLRIVEGEHGSGKLVLDLDYILEWLRADEAGFSFKMVPATLTFLGVTDLRLALNYAASSAAMVPFSIHRIGRRSEVRERYTAQCWTIEINWPTGEIAFEASGYEQKAWGKVKVSSQQHLLSHEREEA
jgi:hypothetical protein